MGFDEPFNLSLLNLILELVVFFVILEDLEEKEIIFCQKLFDPLVDEFFSHIVFLRLDFFIKSDITLDFLKIFDQSLLMVQESIIPAFIFVIFTTADFLLYVLPYLSSNLCLGRYFSIDIKSHCLIFDLRFDIFNSLVNGKTLTCDRWNVRRIILYELGVIVLSIPAHVVND